MIVPAYLALALAVFLAVAYLGANGYALAVVAVAFFAGWIVVAPGAATLWSGLAVLAALISAAWLIPPVRRAVATGPALRVFRRVMPPMSPTESDAINAGTVGWDGELFSGRPDWSRLIALPRPTLSPEERSFLDNETEQLCAMCSEWGTTHHNYDLPPHVWQFIRDQGFLGMIIPKQYGGKGFSAIAHSAVVQKLSTRSSSAAVTVMVPNSLGPAELLLHYGTDEQKSHFLPRLAKGLDIPCFGLTNPHAGSDAAAIPDSGVVCKGLWNGRETLGMRVTWEKRYITLGPVATILGLAFRLHDPDHLLGDTEDLGITCALVPTATPGVHIGRRHLPLNAAFQNGPNWGKDVFMPLDWIIGGPKMAGQGWRMLMECLAAGRSISLPSSNTGMSKLAVRTTGAYARVRRQFKTAIGRFEGVEEPLARMGGNLYMMDAARTMIAGAVDLGEKPSVLSGIVKYHVTEMNRRNINDAMDIQGGKGICLGPNNVLGRAYQQVPVSITVEGANILTRSLIIFGQGAIRCHPYVLAEMRAARDTEPARALHDFDRAFPAHLRFVLTNAARALVMGLTGSHWVRVPADVAPETRRYYQQLTRFSAAFALLADVSMGVMGGALKRREKLSARLGDILSCLYLASATLKRYEDEGRQAADAPLMHWAVWDCLFRAQNAFEGVAANFPSRLAGAIIRRLIFPLGRPYVVPSDALGHEVAGLLITPSATRDRLTAGTYVPTGLDDPVGCLEAALEATIRAEAIEARIREVVKAARAGDPTITDPIAAALAAGAITADEARHLSDTQALRDRVVRVDDFPADFGLAEAVARTSTGALATARAA